MIYSAKITGADWHTPNGTFSGVLIMHVEYVRPDPRPSRTLSACVETTVGDRVLRAFGCSTPNQLMEKERWCVIETHPGPSPRRHEKYIGPIADPPARNYLQELARDPDILFEDLARSVTDSLYMAFEAGGLSSNLPQLSEFAMRNSLASDWLVIPDKETLGRSIRAALDDLI